MFNIELHYMILYYSIYYHNMTTCVVRVVPTVLTVPRVTPCTGIAVLLCQCRVD